MIWRSTIDLGLSSGVRCNGKNIISYPNPEPVIVMVVPPPVPPLLGSTPDIDGVRLPSYV